jgi:RHS repeat-associated protein
VYWTTYTYDASGRTTKVTLPDGSFTTYVYQGNTVTVTDPAGKWKKFTMDAFGNLTSVQEPDPALGTVTTNYTYDILNHLTQVSMPRGGATQTRTFNYASGGTVGAFLLSATNPENGTVTYTYNLTTQPNGGMLASKTDAKGQQITYQYDGYNRLSSVTSANVVLRTYYYDANPLNSTFSQYASGRLTAVQYAQYVPQGTAGLVDMYSYTQGGLVAAKRLQINETVNVGHGNTNVSANLDVAYTYNNEGGMTSVTYPTTNPGGVNTPGASYNYAYDSMMRLSGMTDSSSNSLVSGVTYGASSELLSMTYRPYASTPSITESRTYNSLGQLVNLANANYSGTFMNLEYNYTTGANNGKINSQTDYVSGEQIAYAYDSLNRLISAVTTAASDQVATPWGQGFSYDGFGNLTAKTVLKGSAPSLSIYVDPGTNRANASGSYDANGNAYQYPGMAYDVENRLVSVSSCCSTTGYGYDAQNKRNFITGTYDYYGNATGYTVMLYSPGGQKLGTYRIDLGTNLGAYLMSSQLSGDIYFGSRRISTMDRLGSVGKFYPYGEGKGGTNPADTWSFATYWRDSATNLDYADQRYYSYQFGRFMSPDPYRATATSPSDPRNPQSWNRYAYTRGDPVNRKDPAGLCDQSGDDDFSVTVCGGDDGENSDPFNGWGSLDQRRPLTPGRGPGPADFGSAQASLSSAAELIYALAEYGTFSSNCQRDLNAVGVTPGQVEAAAISVDIENGWGNQQNFASAIWGNSAAYNINARLYGNTTVGQYFAKNLGTVAVSQAQGNHVYVDATWVNSMSDSAIQGLLLHELLHNITGNVDTVLQEQLNTVLPKNQQLTVGAASQNIGNALERDCFK